MQIHTGRGDNLQDSDKYENIGQISIDKGNGLTVKKIVVLISVFLFTCVFIAVASLLMPVLCQFLESHESLLQSIRLVNWGIINGAELCKPAIAS